MVVQKLFIIWGAFCVNSMLEIHQALQDGYELIHQGSAWSFLIKYAKYFFHYPSALQRLYDRSPVRRAFLKSMLNIFSVRYTHYTVHKNLHWFVIDVETINGRAWRIVHCDVFQICMRFRCTVR